jgi:pyoverdine/dityrosine biosynthesis protein Dit1
MEPNQPKYNYWMDLDKTTFQDQVHEDKVLHLCNVEMLQRSHGG